tara:strand:+ start:4500 stop:5249 length:750 start_codon:yes stop_codon:yes gene_type:complete
MKTHLIIPDQHAHPDYNNTRFEWIGKLILDVKPDIVINLGDMADMPSLCTYDKGTKGFEGRRYKKDINCVLDAQERIFAPIKRAKRKKPKFYMCLGNHEERINRAISSEPILDGTISVDDLGYKSFGWKVSPYLEPVIIDRIAYSHFFTSGVMGRPIGGESPAKSLLNKQHMSVTQGHSHTLDLSTAINAAGERMMGLVAGCYLDFKSDWNNPQSENLWWSGIIIKRNVDNGCYDPQFISFDAISKEYT